MAQSPQASLTKPRIGALALAGYSGGRRTHATESRSKLMAGNALSRLQPPLTVAAVFLVVALAAAACSSSGSTSSDPTTPPLPVKTDVGRPLQLSDAPSAGSTCATAADGSVNVTADCVDPLLKQPYVDQDVHKTITDPATKVTVNVRYVHGGFKGTDAKFAFYFPEKYVGRFFESTYPTITVEDAQPETVVFAALNGAYVVSTNNAGGLPKAGDLGGYRTNAASAKFSRLVAAQVYADTARPRGYIYGGSGGAYQTIGALEGTTGVWDGGVPMVPGTPNSIPDNMTAELLGLRVLADKLPQIADAMEPGGSGDPYAGLSTEQQAVLHEVTRLGFPLRGWWDHANLNGGAFYQVAGGVRTVDPTYADDFWTKPGYAGTDPSSSVAAARIQADADVTGLLGASGTGLTLSHVPTGDLIGADLVVTSGAAAGKTVTLSGVSGNDVTLAPGSDPTVTSAIRPGDHVRLDNSWVLALQYYPRYQVPSTDQYAWNQFRDADGKDRFPQRPTLIGPIFAKAASGAVPTGKFHGKMIMLSSVLDAEAFGWSADWYHKAAQASHGSTLNDSYRLWYMDNAGHTPPPTTSSQTHLVSYSGELQQALLDLDAWVVTGTPPPASSNYQVSDTQVQLASTAAQRQGVQPVVTLNITQVGGHGLTPAIKATAAPGQPVTLTTQAQTPAGAGKIVRVDWDFDGTGTFPESSKVDEPVATLKLTTTHTFTKPGTYYAVVRVTAQRDGNPRAPYTLVQNLARARIVVQ